MNRKHIVSVLQTQRHAIRSFHVNEQHIIFIIGQIEVRFIAHNHNVGLNGKSGVSITIKSYSPDYNFEESRRRFTFGRERRR